MKKSKKTFDYSKTRWGITSITSFKTDLQGFELEAFLKNLKNKEKKLNILDIGCGGGNVVGFLSKKFPNWTITGVDVSKTALLAARSKYPKINFKMAGINKLPFKSNSFDVVIVLDVLEHIEGYKAALIEVKRVMKPDSVLFIATPLESQPLTLYYLAYKLGWDLKRRSVGHVNAFNDKDLTKDFRQAGFVIEKSIFAGHLFNVLGDFLYYFLIKSKKDKNFSFDSGITEIKNSFSKGIMIWIRKVFSLISYYESKIFWFMPGGRGHYLLKKSDFFSAKPPVTVCEDLQIKYGLTKMVRPKDVFIEKSIKNWGVDRTSKILDFGTANGLWLERILKTTNARGVGVDVSDNLIKFASKRKNTKGKYLLTGNKWPVKFDYFDYCVSFDVFEHIKDKDLEIKRIFGSLKKGGKFLFYTLNPNNKYTFDWLFEKFGSSYLYDRADHDKKLFPDPGKFKKSLEVAGFKDVSFSLYDGPFNLFWDVFAYAILSLIPSKNLFIINDKMVRFVYPINLFLDKIFNSRGYSNGYFIWGKK